MEIFKLFGSIFVDSDEANKSISKTEKNAEGLGKKLGSSIKTAAKWGAGIAAGITAASGAVVAFAAPMVKAAANAQAMNAQFEQVFGDMQDGATKTLDELGKEFGMLPNRIKPAFSQMTSMFKGLGMDTEDAMGTAEQAVTLVADAAAFYDMSFENANSALNSFIKGNYEGGEAIGLFANETQMASWASENLGVEWKSLDEAGKQVARLEFAKAMQESAGATGQASRESEGFENVMGNLKQAWEDLMVKFGEPLLEPVIGWIQQLTSWLQEVNFQPMIDGFTNLVDWIATGVSTLVTWITEAITMFETWYSSNEETMSGIWTTIQTYFGFVLNYWKTVWETIKTFWQTNGQAILDYAVVYFTAIWDTVKVVFDAVKQIIQTVLELVVPYVQEKLAVLQQFWNENGAQIMEAVQNAFSFIQSVIQFVMPFILTIIKSVWDSIKIVIDGALNIIMGIIKVFSGLLTGDFSKMWEGIKQIFTGAVNAIWGLLQKGFIGRVLAVVTGFVSKAVSSVTGMVSNLRNKFSEVVTTASSKFNEVKDAILTPIHRARDAVSTAVDRIKGFFSGLSLKLPDIKTPHFRLRNWSKNPLDWVNNMPSIGIDWYAKGALFTKPTLFNTPNGIKGFGEAGPEAALPLTESVLGTIGRTIAQTMPQQATDNNQAVLEVLKALLQSSRNIEKKPVLSEGDIGRAAVNHDTRQYTKHSIFTGKVAPI